MAIGTTSNDSTVDISDAVLDGWQSDQIFLRYLRERRQGAPLDKHMLTENASARVWWFTRDTAFSLNRIAQEMPDLKLKVGFKEGHDFSATADLFEGHGIITFDLAVPVMITNIFLGLLCNQNRLSGLVGGDTSDVFFQFPHGDIRPTLFNQGEVPEFISGDQLFLANVFATTCLKFVFLHEFAHVRNGHVDLIKGVSPLAAMGETNQRPLQGITPLDRKTMEWDADRVAYILSSDFGLNRMLGRPYPECRPDERKQAFLKLQPAYYILFRLIQEIERSTTPLELRFHPLPHDRLMFLFVKARDVAKHMGFDVTIEEVSECIMIGEEAWLSAFPNGEASPVIASGERPDELTAIFKLERASPATGAFESRKH
ncbi:hypothetical protein [Rhizobium mongolense]|uniref:hypothetical protein n=1 Tax=Rhizobium mongolense TaxID=57676 RepID=UPI0034A11664